MVWHITDIGIIHVFSPYHHDMELSEHEHEVAGGDIAKTREGLTRGTR